MQHTSPKRTHLAQLAGDLEDSWREVSKCTARFLFLLYEFDRSEAYREWGLVDTAQWLDARCGISRVTAREKVRVARALSELHLIADAFEEGSLSYSQVRALTRYADEDNEAPLLEMAMSCPASELEVRLRAMENGKLLNAKDGEAKANHRLTRHDGEGDRVRFRIELSQEDAGVLVKALEVAKAELLECGPAVSGAGDEPALSADALMLIARRTLSGCFRGSAKEGPFWFLPEMKEAVLDDPSPEQSGPAHLVTVHVDEKALSGNGGHSDLPVPVVRRLLCDGALVGLVEDGDGVPLSVGRRTRTVPVGIRRALEARDRTCRYPGCNHARWLDAHHVVHWADGGETSLENLILLCTHHHKLLHDGEFQIVSRGGKGRFFARADGSPIVVNGRVSSYLDEDESELPPWRKNDPALDAFMREWDAREAASAEAEGQALTVNGTESSLDSREPSGELSNADQSCPG